MAGNNVQTSSGGVIPTLSDQEAGIEGNEGSVEIVEPINPEPRKDAKTSKG